MTVITKAALARELGVSAPRISQLVKQGLPVRPDGKLDRDLALAWLRKHGSLRLHSAAGGAPVTQADIDRVLNG